MRKCLILHGSISDAKLVKKIDFKHRPYETSFFLLLNKVFVGFKSAVTPAHTYFFLCLPSRLRRTCESVVHFISDGIGKSNFSLKSYLEKEARISV